MNIGELLVKITADTAQMQTALNSLQNELKKASEGVNNIARTMEQRMKAAGESMVKTGKKMSLAITAPLMGAGVAAFKLQMDFERSMTQIVSLVGVAREQVDEWSKDVITMAPKLAKAPAELADALFFITSAGIRGAEAMEVLEMSAKASVAGLGETKVIADLATSAMNAYGTANLSAEKAMDILVATVREGKAEAPELAASMGAVLPLASKMGVSFDQVGATMAAMTRTGTKASEAATQLRAIMASMIKPTKQAEEALNGMGTSSAELRNTIKEKGLFQALLDINNLTKQYGEETVAQVFPNIRALSGVLDLMGSGAADNAKIYESLANSTGMLSTAFEEASKDAEFKWNQDIASSKTALTAFGETLKTAVIPILESFSSGMQRLTTWFTGLSDSWKQAILIIGGVVAAIGPLLVIVGKFMILLPGIISAIKGIGVAFKAVTAFAAANPFVLIASAVAALILVITKLWKESEVFRAVVKYVAQSVVVFFERTWINIKMGAELMWRGIKTYFTAIPKLAAAVWQIVKRVIAGEKIADVIKDEFSKLVTDVTDDAAEIKDKYSEQLKSIESPNYQDILAMEKAKQEAKKTGEETGKELTQGVVSGIEDMEEDIEDGLGKAIGNAGVRSIQTLKKELEELQALSGSFAISDTASELALQTKIAEKSMEIWRWEQGIQKIQKERFDSMEKVDLIKLPDLKIPDFELNFGDEFIPSVDMLETSLSKVSTEMKKAKDSAKLYGEEFDSLGEQKKLLGERIKYLIDNGFSMESNEVQVLADQYRKLNEEMETAKQSTIELGSMISSSLGDAFTTLGENIGTLVSGENSMSGFLKNMLGVVLDFGAQFGKALIAVGVGKLALDNVMKVTGAAGAIAAGVALTALVSAAKSILSKGVGGGASSGGGGNISAVPALASGGLAYAPTLAMVGDNPRARVNPEVIAPLDTLKHYMDGNSGTLSVPREIVLRASGGDLEGSLRFEQKRQRNLR